VVSTLRLYYDALIAVALMAVVASICGLIAAVITGDSSPNFPVAAIALLLIGAFIFLRLWSKPRSSALPLE
jgi:LPXTG-motif cell wall-anchored protein